MKKLLFVLLSFGCVFSACSTEAEEPKISYENVDAADLVSFEYLRGENDKKLIECHDTYFVFYEKRYKTNEYDYWTTYSYSIDGKTLKVKKSRDADDKWSVGEITLVKKDKFDEHIYFTGGNLPDEIVGVYSFSRIHNKQ